MKNFIFFILITCLIVLNNCDNEFPSMVRIDYLMVNAFYLSLRIPSMDLQNHEKLSLQLPASYFNMFNNNFSIWEIDTVEFDKKTYTRNLLFEDIECGNIPVSICFYQVPNLPFNKNAYSFSLQYINDSYSIIHQLKKKNKIKDLIFSFQPESDLGGRMYVGGIPRGIIENKYKMECNVIGEQWGCHFNMIYLSNKENETLFSYKDNSIALFDTALEGIRVPRKYFSYLSQVIFKEQIAQGHCYIKEEEIKYIVCHESVKEKIGKYVNIVLEGKALTIESKVLINQEFKKPNEIGFYIIENSNDKWILGSNFIHFFISSFDYDNRKVSFFSNVPIKVLSIDDNNHNIFFLVIVTIIILVIGFIINLLSLFKFQMN